MTQLVVELVAFLFDEDFLRFRVYIYNLIWIKKKLKFHHHLVQQCLFFSESVKIIRLSKNKSHFWLKLFPFFSPKLLANSKYLVNFSILEFHTTLFRVGRPFRILLVELNKIRIRLTFLCRDCPVSVLSNIVSLAFFQHKAPFLSVLKAFLRVLKRL